MALQDYYLPQPATAPTVVPVPPQMTTQALPGYTAPTPTQSSPLTSLWNTGLNVYDYYKSRDTASDVAKNLSEGYTAGQEMLDRYLSPYAAPGAYATGAYAGLADQYPGFAPDLPQYGDYDPGALSLPQYADYDPGAFDPSQLRDPEYLASTPGYQFRLEQGQEAREAAAAARGLNLSTNVLRDLDAYSQGMASQEYGREYDRLRDMYGLETQRAQTRYGADVGRTAAEYDAATARAGKLYGEDYRRGMDLYGAEQGDYLQRMQNYLPLMQYGYGAGTTMGRTAAELEVARGGAAGMREQAQGTLQSKFLGDITSGYTGGAGGGGSLTEQLGIDDWSLGSLGDSFGNLADWWNDPNTSIGGTAMDFWEGIRDFDLGDLEGALDFFL